MLSIGLIPPIFIICCLVIMPESPRWVQQNSNLSLVGRPVHQDWESVTGFCFQSVDTYLLMVAEQDLIVMLLLLMNVVLLNMSPNSQPGF